MVITSAWDPNSVNFFLTEFKFEFSLFYEFEFSIFIVASSSPVKIYQVFSSLEKNVIILSVYKMKINSSFLKIF